ncbi:hypothetical protein SLA2020_077470 [Shorea laevis]
MAKMMTKNDRFEGYYRNTYGPPGDLEDSDSSGRIDTEMTASEDSSAPARKSITLNTDNRDTFGVPVQALSLSNMSSSERKDLTHKLQLELQQIRMLQKKVEYQSKNGVMVSSSSDILSCSNGQKGPYMHNLKKSSMAASGPRKKGNPVGLGGKAHGWNRDTSGRFESAKQASTPNTANMLLMKQCENLLKRLMGHQHGWVFKHPVDVVKLNIPDYFTVIKHPMDLGTIKSKIASGAYASPLEFLADVRLTFTNAMTYNPPGNDVHIMADTLSKFFEVRWKNIEKKIPTNVTQSGQPKSGPTEVMEKILPPAKKRKISFLNHDTLMRKMTDEEKLNLNGDLESLLGEMPVHIVDFLREHSSNGGDLGGEELEIDINDLSDDTLFKLRKLLDDYLLEKQKNQSRAEPCEIELLNESGLSNSSMQQGKGNDLQDEDVDIGNEPPVSSYPPVEIAKEACHRSTKSVNLGSPRDSDSSNSDGESDAAKLLSPVDATKVQETVGSGAQLDEREYVDNPLDRKQSFSGLDQLEQNSQQKPSSVESDSCQDGESTPSERQISPEKLYRAAYLKTRFADTILKAREKTLTQVDMGDRQKMEELELQKKKEKERMQAEAKAVLEARKRAEAAEARRKMELEREKQRQELLQMEKTVEINENSRFLEDLELLRSGPAEQLPSSVDETSPDHLLDGLGSFKFGSSNPLEQLGLYMKEDEEEEEGEPPIIPKPANDVEEGEID